MKVLHYSLGFPPYRSGGLTKFALDLMREQLNEGNEVALLKKRHAMALKMVKAISVEGLDILNHEISYPLFTE